MQVAIVTVGDELLAGDIENTNATWLARQLTDRGARVARVLTLPDELGVIADAVGRYRQIHDAVLVTGGLGGTHDDVTMDAIAEATGRELVVDPDAREHVVEVSRAYREANPDVVDRYDFQFDPDAWAEQPAGSRTILNDAGLAPGCVVDAGADDPDAAPVYVFPGPPEELQAVFARVADEFGGDLVSTMLRSPAPESALVEHMEAARERFDVAVGSYPATGDEDNRIKISGPDPAEVERAVEWVRERVDVVEGSAERSE